MDCRLRLLVSPDPGQALTEALQYLSLLVVKPEPLQCSLISFLGLTYIEGKLYLVVLGILKTLVTEQA